MTISVRQDRKLRRLIGALPHGSLLLLAALCMLIVAVGAARASDAPADKMRRVSAAAHFVPETGAPLGDAVRTPRILSVDLTECDVIPPQVSDAAPASRPVVPASVRLSTGVAR